MSSTRPRVLIIAEQANPEWVSVPLEGWSLAVELARITDAHVVTQVRNAAAMTRAGWVEGRDFTAIDSERVAARIGLVARLLRGGKGKGWTAVTATQAIAYPYFERLVWRRFGDRIRGGEFDLVHRLTPISPTAPSPIARRCHEADVPFVVGPLNGGVPWPAGFDAARRRENEWLSYVRGLHRLMPGYRATRRYASAILCGSRDTLKQVPARYQHKCRYVAENGADLSRFTERRTRRAERPLRGVFIGRLVPYKGGDMLLEAAAPLVKAGGLTLDIVGDGPEMPTLRAIAEREALGEGVRFRGWVEHKKLAGVLAEMDLLTFPSIREFGGGVIVEAMAVGVVPVVVDYGGPGDLVSEATGYKLPIGPREAIVRDLRRVLESLAADPSAVDVKSQAARSDVEARLTWSAKAQQVLQVYREVMRPRADEASSSPARVVAPS